MDERYRAKRLRCAIRFQFLSFFRIEFQFRQTLLSIGPVNFFRPIIGIGLMTGNAANTVEQLATTLFIPFTPKRASYWCRSSRQQLQWLLAGSVARKAASARAA